jgi:hypothetical protein
MKNVLEKFVDMCSLIQNNDQKIFFPFDTVEYTTDYSYLTEDKDYDFLKEKMSNLITLLNQDNSLIEKDIETELWNMI